MTKKHVAHNPTVHPELLANQKPTKASLPATIWAMVLTAASGLWVLARNTNNRNPNIPHAASLAKSMRQGKAPAHGLEPQAYMDGANLVLVSKATGTTDGQHTAIAAVLAFGDRSQWVLLCFYLGWTRVEKVDGKEERVADIDRMEKATGLKPLDKPQTTKCPWLIVNEDAHPLSFLAKNGTGQLKATAGSFLARDPAIAEKLARHNLDSELAATVCRLLKLCCDPGRNYTGLDVGPRFGSIRKGGNSAGGEKVVATWKKYETSILEAWRLCQPHVDRLKKFGLQFVVAALALGLLGRKSTVPADCPEDELPQVWDNDRVAAAMQGLCRSLDSVGKTSKDSPTSSSHLIVELSRMETRIVNDKEEERLAARRMLDAEILRCLVEIFGTGDSIEYTQTQFRAWFVSKSLDNGTSNEPEQCPSLRWIGPDSTLSHPKRVG